MPSRRGISGAVNPGEHIEPSQNSLRLVQCKPDPVALERAQTFLNTCKDEVEKAGVRNRRGVAKGLGGCPCVGRGEDLASPFEGFIMHRLSNGAICCQANPCS